MQGTIIKIISNQYTLLTEDNDIIQAVAMGKVRLQDKPVVGDKVEYDALDGQYGIQKILPRKNRLVRPAVANVDQAMIVMSAIDPPFSSNLVDKLNFLISYEDIEPIIVITKMDLVKEDDEVYRYIEDYRNSGYTVILSGHDLEVNDIEKVVCDNKITVLAGQSGVGKSTLLNKLNPDFELQTQEISKARGRGKHTTRHTELFPVGGGWVADTPGFSSLDFSRIDAKMLADSIKDFKNFPDCRFKDCVHINEPDCAIKKGVEEGKVSAIRWQNYKEVVPLCNQRKEWEK